MKTYAEYCRQAAAIGAKPMERAEWNLRKASRKATEAVVKKVIILGRNRDTIRDVAPVVRETKTLVIAGHDGKETYQLKKPYKFEFDGRRRTKVYGEYQYPSDEELRQAEFMLNRQKMLERREQTKREKAEAKEKADPRYELLKRFTHAEWEPWDKLSLEQLQQIAAILDSVK